MEYIYISRTTQRTNTGQVPAMATYSHGYDFSVPFTSLMPSNCVIAKGYTIVFYISLIPTDAPIVPRESLQYFISCQECYPNGISVLIQVDEIQDIAPLTYKLNLSSPDGCVLQECPTLLSPRQRSLTITLLNGVNYTATLEVSNDCGSNNITVPINPGMQF